MRPSDRRRTLENLTRIAAHLDRNLEQIVERIHDAQAGHPRAQRFGPTIGGHRIADDDDQARPTIADPVGGAAVTRADGRDRASRHLRDLDRALASVERETDRIRKIAEQYAARPPARHERAETSTDGEPGCSSCARLDGAHGGPRWEPIYRHVTLPNGTVHALCRWCRDWATQIGRLPHRRELQAHHDGKRVKRPAAVTVTVHEQQHDVRIVPVPASTDRDAIPPVVDAPTRSSYVVGAFDRTQHVCPGRSAAARAPSRRGRPDAATTRPPGVHPLREHPPESTRPG